MSTVLVSPADLVPASVDLSADDQVALFLTRLFAQTRPDAGAVDDDDGASPNRDVPPIEKRKVPVREANTAYRRREYLLDQEVTAVMAAAARSGRHGARDAALILLAYRHGLRVSELVSLRWDQVNLLHGPLHVARRKHGIPSVHPIRRPELRALRRLQRDEPEMANVFVSERKAPRTTDAVRKIVGRAGRQAGIVFPVHPHMLRHATGYKLA